MQVIFQAEYISTSYKAARLFKQRNLF